VRSLVGVLSAALAGLRRRSLDAQSPPASRRAPHAIDHAGSFAILDEIFLRTLRPVSCTACDRVGVAHAASGAHGCLSIHESQREVGRS
jgi:hypothetical protein